MSTYVLSNVSLSIIIEEGCYFMKLPVSIADIQAAATRLKPMAYHTPLLRQEKLDAILGCRVYIKPENLQKTGSFKIRGASNKLLTLTDEEKAKGIIASSSGNHAQGVACAAEIIGVQARVVMPQNAPQSKIDGTRAFGAEVILHGYDSIERYKKLYQLADAYNYTVVHSFNDPALIAGQGTVGLEIMQDLKDVDTVIVPLGGGGILAGVAVAVKETNPNCRVIGVEPAAIPRYSASFAAGHPVEVPFKATIADGLMLTKTGSYTYPIIKQYVDAVVTVEDKYIIMALQEIIFKAKLVIEPSAAIGLAAVLAGALKVQPEEKVVFVLTGGNIDANKLVEYIS